MAFETEGAIVKIGADTIGEVVSWEYDDGERRIIDTTHLSSTREDWVPGLPASGTLNMELNLLPNDQGQKKAWQAKASKAITAFTLTIPIPPSALTFTFNARVMQFTFGAPTNDKLGARIGLRLVGGLTGFPAPSV
jgi:hypothetical protein